MTGTTADVAYQREWSDPHCRWPGEAAAQLAAAPWRRVVAVGDSVATGVREPVDGYRDMDSIGRVVEALRAEHPSLAYHNVAERDLRIAEIRRRQLSLALELRPDLVIVAAGGNDTLSRSFDDEHVAAELRLLVEPLVTQGAALITMGLFDLPRSGLVREPYAGPMAERFDRLDELTRAVAAEYSGAHSASHRHPLAADPSIFASDGIHANARGHAVAAATLVRALISLVR